MSKWKGTGIKVWPCLENAKCPFGEHHVYGEERTGQKRSRDMESKLRGFIGAEGEEKVPVKFPLRTVWSSL